MAMNKNEIAYRILNSHGVDPTKGRVEKLVAVIESHGECVRIELVKRGGRMRKMPVNAANIGRIRATGEDIWAVWN